MDSLLKAAENFVEETFDESLFVEFMRKVPIWEYFCISKQVYLNMTEQEKRDKISSYHSAMKNRHVQAGEFLFLYLFIFLSVISYKYVSVS